MEKLLFINGCVREGSRTLELAKTVLSKWQGEVSEVNLDKENIPSLNSELLNKRHGFEVKKDFSDDMFRYARQFVEADVILMAAPYWDLSFPAMIRTYLESVTVTGLSFYYTEQGYPAGLCKARKLIYVTTAGGPIWNPDFGFDYIKTLAQMFYGIKDVNAYKAENLDIIGSDVDGILNQVKADILANEI